MLEILDDRHVKRLREAPALTPAAAAAAAAAQAEKENAAPGKDGETAAAAKLRTSLATALGKGPQQQVRQEA